MRSAAVFAIVALLAVVGLAALFGFGGGGQGRALDTSVMGVEGLRTWLPEEGLAVTRSHPRLSPKASDLSLRILPLYDVDLSVDAPVAKTREELSRQTTQRDLQAGVLFEKLQDLPTLVVLPKWQTGFASTAVAHASLLIHDDLFPRLCMQLDLRGLRLRHGRPAFETARLKPADGAAPRDVALFQAQLFTRASLPGHCRERIGLPDGALLISCEAKGITPAAHYLSDPDILNNHGLSLAENAAFASAMIAGLRPLNSTKAVYLDTSTELLLDMDEADAEARPYTREPEDLARFFTWPLSVLWGVAALILAVTLWRGARRFGPPARMGENRVEASKTAAINAKARLLRLSGNDGRMAAEFVQARLADLAAQTFGPGLGDTATPRLFAHLASRNAALAADFRAVTASLISQGSTLSRPELHRQLETFRELLERIADGTGPISKPH